MGSGTLAQLEFSQFMHSMVPFLLLFTYLIELSLVDSGGVEVALPNFIL